VGATADYSGMSDTVRAISACRVCGNTNLVPVLDLGTQALTGRFPKAGEPDPLAGPLELVLCHTEGRPDRCGLLQLAHSYPLAEMYGETYGYRSSNNGTMVRHLHRKVERLQRFASLHAGDAVLDIGSNDGTLLGFYEHLPVRSVGIDPSAGRFAREYPREATLLVDFFDPAKVLPFAGTDGFKVITSLAMFYDLDAPLAFMRDIESLLARDGVWVFEQAYLPDMVERLAYDSVCHEHLSYYSLNVILWMARRAGLKIIDIERNDINGGSFSITAARESAPYPAFDSGVAQLLALEQGMGLHSLDTNVSFAQRVAQHRDRMQHLLSSARRRGQLVLGYGASTKGNVILQYCQFTPHDLPAIAEKYAAKFGCVTPGTRIPIISESDARSQNPHAFLVLPWYFRDEIAARESAFTAAGGQLLFPLPDIQHGLPQLAGKLAEVDLVRA